MSIKNFFFLFYSKKKEFFLHNFTAISNTESKQAQKQRIHWQYTKKYTKKQLLFLVDIFKLSHMEGVDLYGSCRSLGCLGLWKACTATAGVTFISLKARLVTLRDVMEM